MSVAIGEYVLKEFVGELEDAYKQAVVGEIILVSDPGVAEPCWCMHHCPCGCERLRTLPVFGTGWRVVLDAEKMKVSISPSILDIDACKAHYFIESNKVRFV